MLDRVTDRRKMREELILICRMLMKQTPPTWGDLPIPGEGDVASQVAPEAAVPAKGEAKAEDEKA
jgi:acetyl-CoA carboxylase carboxyl transferase subunit beta